MTHASRRPTLLLAWAGIAGPAMFAALVTVSPLFQPGYDWREEDISALFASDAAHPWLMASGVLALGLGTLALAAASRRNLDRGEASDIGCALLLGLGIVISGAAFFHNDCSTETKACAARVRAGHVSWQHHVHDAASGLIFLLLLAAPLVLAHAFRADGRWSGMYGWSMATGLAGAVLLIAYLVRPVEAGVLQRAAIGLPVLWLATVGWRLTRADAASASAPHPVPLRRVLR
jgi:hypothetical membrane protein